MEYSAKEVAELLRKEGLTDITSRTINYYAFDKKMFNINSVGKKCFTNIEIDKIKGIKKLQELTKFTLEQIKEIINKYSYEEIESRFSQISYKTVEDFKSTYSVKSMAPRVFSNNINLNSSSNECNSSYYANSDINIEEINLKSNNLQRNLRINEDITLTISNNIDNEKLQKIVKNIQAILKENK